MRDRLIELLNKQSCPSPLLCDKNCKYAHLQTCYAERVADHLLANGVIVPPCKVGDKVYVPDKGEVKELYVKYVNNDRDGIEIVIYPEFETKFGYSFRNNKIGKTVFLTKEEAEQVLKGGEG